MKIGSGDIQYRLSGGAANTNPNASLGGGISDTGIPTGVLNNLFDDITGDQAQTGYIDHRCMYVRNGHASITWQTVVAWIYEQTLSPNSQIEIAAGTSGLNGTEQTIANETTPPVGVSWTLAPDKPSGLNFGDIPAGQHYAIWIRRTIQAGAQGYSDDAGTVRAEGDTVVTP